MRVSRVGEHITLRSFFMAAISWMKDTVLIVGDLRGLVATRSRRERRHKGEDLHHAKILSGLGPRA